MRKRSKEAKKQKGRGRGRGGARGETQAADVETFESRAKPKKSATPLFAWGASTGGGEEGVSPMERKGERGEEKKKKKKRTATSDQLIG
jgi:hypothetical protein